MMIGDRFDFGVGISPWPEDFEATQIAWEKRGKRMDEMMEIINGLMSGDYFESVSYTHLTLPTKRIV